MRKLSSLFLMLMLLSACNSQEKVLGPPEQTLRLAAEADPQTLDPRLSRTLLDTTVMHMLYEGLMHIGADGKPAYSLAESITASPDLKTYNIVLKESQWSDGSPVTSADFVEAWKSILDPLYPSPNASQLFVIKNAREAKAGQTSLENVGLRVTSNHTFTIELENPIAFFEELLSSHFFLPQHISVRQMQ